MKTKSQIIEIMKLAVEDISLGRLEAKSVLDKSRIIADLGLDSMDYATLMLTTEQQSGIKIREDGVNWAEIETLDQLADLFIKNSSR
jgi:acyl carrier protein